MGEVRRPLELDEAAVRHRRVRGTAVLDRDRAVALAPGDQGRYGVEQVQAVGRADALAAGIDHRAEGVHERLARARAAERPQRAGDRLQLDPEAGAALT